MIVFGQRRKPRLISHEIIFANIPTLYDHDTSMSQMDGQTNRRLAVAIPRSVKTKNAIGLISTLLLLIIVNCFVCDDALYIVLSL